MTVALRIKELFESGDPVIRSWPLVQSFWTPFALTTLYVILVTRVGPAIMRNRKPFDLRLLMITYNFSVVIAYASCLLAMTYLFFTTDSYKTLCSPTIVTPGHYTYYYSAVAWYLYMLKYIEFADTAFFILRKKFNLITNLHVIHHAVLPLIIWSMMRSETSGFQMIPLAINAFIHVIMYTYYGLAAMGPDVQKTLWWKEYLTLLQMSQFVVILLFMSVIVPLIGCITSTHGLYTLMFFAALFLLLFYNFYRRTYKKSVIDLQHCKMNGESEAKEVNGVREKNGYVQKNR